MVSLVTFHIIGAFKRLLTAVPALLGILVVTFLLLRVLPGDPAGLMAPPSASNDVLDEIRKQMGLDKSIPEQLAIYAVQVAQGDLGQSHMTGQSVTTDLWRRLPASIELITCALIVALIFSLPLGVAAALRQGSLIDHFVRVVCTFGVAIPTFVSGLLLIYIFYYDLGWAPDPTGRMDIFATAPSTFTGFYLIDSLLVGDVETFWAAARQLVLPTLTLALFVVAPLTRVTRASMLSVLESDYIRMAEATGLSRPTIIVVYALRNAILPVLTTLGPVFSSLLGANVMVEKVFAWPGIASYAADGLASSDFAPVQGFVLLMAVAYVVLNWLIDVLSSFADPRVSL
ncbi:ABC transporter permease [Ochrobactrum sp. XJ1]|nr:ABC transporter permease [Ochrobactrum sp. XJ1]